MNNVSEKNILLVGCTGAGKTTLVDAFFNYLAGVAQTDDFRLQITDQCNNEDQTKSQTKTTTCYTLPKTKYLLNKCSLNIIDTPGFNDTDDKDVQMKIVRQVNALLTTRISTLDAICIVCPLSSFRLTEAQKSVLNGIFQLFAHDVSDMIYCLFTFDDGGKEYVLKGFLDAKIRLKAHFRFCNSDLFDKTYGDNKDDDNKKNDANKKLESHMKDEANKHWLKNSLNFKPFLDLVYRSDGKSTKLTREVLKGVDTLQIQLKGLQLNVSKSTQNVVNLRQEFKLLNEHKVKKGLGDHFEYFVTEEKHIIDRTSNQKRCLNCRTCERTCHENCWAIFKILYWNCKVLKSGSCTVCNCGSTDHVNESVIYRIEYEQIIKTDEDLKKKFATAEDAKDKLKDELRELDKSIKKIRNCIDLLKEKALRYDECTILDYIDKLYKEEFTDLKPGYEDRARIYAMLKKNIDSMEPAMTLLD